MTADQKPERRTVVVTTKVKPSEAAILDRIVLALGQRSGRLYTRSAALGWCLSLADSWLAHVASMDALTVRGDATPPQ